MKASSIWRNNDYAYEYGGWRRDKSPLPMHSQRARVLRTREVLGWGSERATTMVTVNVLSDDGKSVLRTNHEVPGRHLIDFWDSYEEERQLIRNRVDAAEDERKRLEEEKRNENEAVLAEFLSRTGFRRDQVGWFTDVLQITKKEIVNWLQLSIPKTSENSGETPSHVQRWLDGSATPTEAVTGVDNDEESLRQN